MAGDCCYCLHAALLLKRIDVSLCLVSAPLSRKGAVYAEIAFLSRQSSCIVSNTEVQALTSIAQAETQVSSASEIAWQE